jgi:hypothetical protein
MAAAMRLWNEQGGTPITDRSREELARFFDRLELLEPGVSRVRGAGPSPPTPSPPPGGQVQRPSRWSAIGCAAPGTLVA